METAYSDNQKQLSAFIHLSTFAKFIFPFANFFVPLILWTSNSEKPFVDHNGRQAINFQLSILLYGLAIVLLCLPFAVIFLTDFITLVESIDHSGRNLSVSQIGNLSGFIMLLIIGGLLLFGLFLFELYAVVTATIYAGKGIKYRYPLCISFLKTQNQKTNNKTDHHEHTS
jgi:uncharacterized Tic20 family protein